MWGNVCGLVGTGYYFGMQTYVPHIAGLSGRWTHLHIVFASTFLFWVLSCFSCYWVYFRTETYVQCILELSRRWITSYRAVGVCCEWLRPNGLTWVTFWRSWWDLCSSGCWADDLVSEQSHSHLRSLITPKYSPVLPPRSSLCAPNEGKALLLVSAPLFCSLKWKSLPFLPQTRRWSALVVSWWSLGKTRKKSSHSDQGLKCMRKDVGSVTQQRRESKSYRILFVE